ncbi:MAG: HAMP domain-containing histidine kinase [Lachnospiraceae bacterium]|nr:HAMP domain-containing histidine kinase [Lachnospiraceae bacterium]
MHKTKGWVGFFALVFFVLTAVSLLRGWPTWVLVLMVLLHSMCLMLLAFIYSTERNDYTGTDELQQELSVLRIERENEKATMQRALDAREIELNSRKEEVEKLKNDAAVNEQKLSSLQAAVKNAEEQLGVLRSEATDFLPPAEETPLMIDIIKVAREAVDELTEAARKAGMTIQISSAEENIFVKAQPSRLRILFRNIIDNSIKYMQRAGTLVITISTVGDDIFIVLKDTGMGLREEETEHIFELNFQGSNRISGNGLGLTQAKAIVEYYGGTIYGRSMPDKGMGIYIQLPGNRRNKEAEE